MSRQYERFATDERTNRRAHQIETGCLDWTFSHQRTHTHTHIRTGLSGVVLAVGAVMTRNPSL